MLSYLSSLFLLVGPLSFVVQIALCVHVYRTGRPFWWIWLIMMGSLVGCVLYVLLEILPGARWERAQTGSASWLLPKRVIIRRARERLDETDTVENRLNLASLLYDSGNKTEAEQVVAVCATGVFADDPEVISRVAWYKVAAGKLAEAEQLILKANTRNNKLAGKRIDLLKARILLGYGKNQEALSVFTSLQSAHLGEEPRYYSALCHLGLGNTAEARKVLNDMTRYFRKGGKIWRRSERAWYKAACLKLKEIQSKK